MPIQFVDRYTRQEIRDNPHKRYVFGDNFARRGFGGQAKEARNEPNAIGIPTKWNPTMNESDFLKESDFAYWVSRIGPQLTEIDEFLEMGGIVVWPMDGIGTGLAKLAHNAPSVKAFLELFLENMIKNYGTVLDPQTAPQ